MKTKKEIRIKDIAHIKGMVGMLRNIYTDAYHMSDFELMWWCIMWLEHWYSVLSEIGIV